MQVNTFAPSRSPRRAEWFSDRILRAHDSFLFDHLETNSLPNIICCQDHNISTKLSMQYSQHIKHIWNVYFQRSPWRRRRRGLGCPDSGSPRPSSVVPRGWSLPELDSLVGPGNPVYSIKRMCQSPPEVHPRQIWFCQYNGSMFTNATNKILHTFLVG